MTETISGDKPISKFTKEELIGFLNGRSVPYDENHTATQLRAQVKAIDAAEQKDREDKAQRVAELPDDAGKEAVQDVLEGDPQGPPSTDFTSQFAEQGPMVADPDKPEPDNDGAQEKKEAATANSEETVPSFETMPPAEIRAWLKAHDREAPKDMNDDELPAFARDESHQSKPLNEGNANGGSGDPSTRDPEIEKGDPKDLKPVTGDPEKKLKSGKSKGGKLDKSGVPTDAPNDGFDEVKQYTVVEGDGVVDYRTAAAKFGHPNPFELAGFNGVHNSQYGLVPGDVVLFPTPHIPTLEDRGIDSRTGERIEGKK